MPLELEILASSPVFLFAPVTRFQLQSGFLKAFTNADVLLLSIAFIAISSALLRIERRRNCITALAVWALVVIGMLAWTSTIPLALSGAISPNFNCVLYNPPPKSLSFVLNATSARAGSVLSFTTTGWSQGEDLLLMVFNQGSGKYIQEWSGYAGSKGSASGTFKALNSLLGQDSVYVEDPNSPFPHTGYISPYASLTVTS
jgi:hypothetical protein